MADFNSVRITISGTSDTDILILSYFKNFTLDNIKLGEHINSRLSKASESNVHDSISGFISDNYIFKKKRLTIVG